MRQISTRLAVTRPLGMVVVSFTRHAPKLAVPNPVSEIRLTQGTEGVSIPHYSVDMDVPSVVIGSPTIIIDSRSPLLWFLPFNHWQDRIVEAAFLAFLPVPGKRWGGILRCRHDDEIGDFETNPLLENPSRRWSTILNTDFYHRGRGDNIAMSHLEETTSGAETYINHYPSPFSINNGLSLQESSIGSSFSRFGLGSYFSQSLECGLSSNSSDQDERPIEKYWWPESFVPLTCIVFGAFFLWWGRRLVDYDHDATTWIRRSRSVGVLFVGLALLLIRGRLGRKIKWRQLGGNA
jgi:hypothetical protein